MRFSLGGLAPPTEVSSRLSQHFPCSGAMGRDSNALMLKGQPRPLVLASFPGTMLLLPFLSCSTDGGAAGKGPPLTRASRPEEGPGDSRNGSRLDRSCQLPLPSAGGAVTQHSRDGQIRTQDQTLPGSAARGSVLPQTLTPHGTRPFGSGPCSRSSSPGWLLFLLA